MDRYKFDKYLVSLIPDNIKKINGRVVFIKKEDNYILEVLDSGKKKIIKSKMIVGADGCNSIVRRTFYKNDIIEYEKDGKIFVETSPTDRIWGIGLSVKTPEAILGDEKNWRGTNLLGQCINSVREKLLLGFGRVA